MVCLNKLYSADLIAIGYCVILTSPDTANLKMKSDYLVYIVGKESRRSDVQDYLYLLSGILVVLPMCYTDSE